MRFLALLLLFAALSFAAPCSDYYSPYSISVSNFFTDKASYSPGAEVKATAVLRESFGRPLPELQITAFILRNEQIIGSVSLPETALRANESRTVSFSWRVPSSSANGNYSLALLAYSAGYPVAGYSYAPGSAAAATGFTVSGAPDSFIEFISSSATASSFSVSLRNNGEEADILFYPDILVGEEAHNAKVFSLIQQGLVPSDSLLAAQFSAAQALTRNLSSGKGSIILSLPAGAEADLNFKWPASALPPGFYVLKLFAKKGDSTSTLFLPLEVNGEGGRLAYAGLDSFPIRKGSEARLALCAQALSDSESNASFSLEVSSEGQAVARTSAVIPLSLAPEAAGGKFTSPSDLRTASTLVYLRDSSGRVLDVAQASYDSSLFSPNAVLSLSASSSGTRVSYSILLSDDSGVAIPGKIDIILSGPGSSQALPGVLVNGKLSGSFLVSSGGAYKLTVIEPTLQKTASADIFVQGSPAAPQNASLPTLPPGKPVFDLLPLILFLLVILLLVILRFVWQGKPKGFK